MKFPINDFFIFCAVISYLMKIQGSMKMSFFTFFFLNLGSFG